MLRFRKNHAHSLIATVVVTLLSGCAKVSNAPQGAASLTSSPQSNAAPAINGQPQNAVAAGSAYLFRPSASDPDGDDLSYSIQNKPGWAIFSPATGMLTGVPAVADAGIYANIIVSVSDGIATANLPAFSIAVSPIAGAPSAGTGLATLSWSAPTENTDGSALTDLAGYRVYAGASATSLAVAATLPQAAAPRFTVEGLPAGTWYFAVAAVNSSGVESPLSNIGSKTIP
jgi:Putative Ig domain